MRAIEEGGIRDTRAESILSKEALAGLDIRESTYTVDKDDGEDKIADEEINGWRVILIFLLVLVEASGVGRYLYLVCCQCQVLSKVRTNAV